MRQMAALCSWVLLAAACSSAQRPTATATSADTTQLNRTATALASSTLSPTPVVFTRGRVEIGDNFYAPEEITVTVGATVTWQINQGENNHDVVSTEACSARTYP